MSNRVVEIMEEAKCPYQVCKPKPYVPINYTLIVRVLRLEGILDKKVIITSGNRCTKYNKSIGGYWDSPHIPRPKGKALDIKAPGMNNIELAYKCEKAGFKRIGIYPNHIHIDEIEPRPSKFWYKKSYQSTAVYSKGIKTLKEFLIKLKKEGGLNQNDLDIFNNINSNSTDYLSINNE